MWIIWYTAISQRSPYGDKSKYAIHVSFLQAVEHPSSTSMQVNDLSPNQEYMFRVSAINKCGQGPWLTTNLVFTTPPAPGKSDIYTEW